MIENNRNLIDFAAELEEIVGQRIKLEHIHAAKEGRYYYIQAPKPGAPLLLNHYCGPFFVDMHPDDFRSLKDGNISAHDYITSANWQIGYYWRHTMDMIHDAYYQPFDIVGQKDAVRRYFKILGCRRNRAIHRITPTGNECNECPVEGCLYSPYKAITWKAEAISEFDDPRKKLLGALRKRFKEVSTEYNLRSLCCDDEVPEGEIWFEANWVYPEKTPSFTAYTSDTVIRSLMMREVQPADWDEYARGFSLRIIQNWHLSNTRLCDMSVQNLKEASDERDLTSFAS